MKALLLIGSLFIAGVVTISATKKNLPDLSRDQTFVNSVDHIATIPMKFHSSDETLLNDELKKIANSIDVLKKNYPDLNNPGTAGITTNDAVNKLARENKTTIHGDTCLRDFVKEFFTCFRSCSSHSVLKACLSTACANYQDCKDGGPSR